MSYRSNQHRQQRDKTPRHLQSLNNKNLKIFFFCSKLEADQRWHISNRVIKKDSRTDKDQNQIISLIPRDSLIKPFSLTVHPHVKQAE